MNVVGRLLLLLRLAFWGILVFGVVFDAQADTRTPKRVLLIHSFGRDFEPYASIAAIFRTGVAQGPDYILFYEATLDAGGETSAQTEQTFVAYLRSRFASGAPDLVVTFGPPAAKFYLRHRDELFGATPLLLTALDERHLQGATLQPNDSAVLSKTDIPRLFDNMFQLFPRTKLIAIVVGSSQLERFWVTALKAVLAHYAVNVLWLDTLPLAQIKKRVAKLPPDSVVFLPLFIVDGAGVPHDRLEALAMLRSAANAPIFGPFDTDLGKGVVGGPLTSQSQIAEAAVAEGLRMLSGATSTAPRIQVFGFATPAYDERELDRWNVDRSRLPPGSDLRFKPPSLWDEHRAAAIAISAAILLQATMITALLAQRIRRRKAEREARTLGGLLITAHEDERRRLARELHDHFTQRLASLAIQSATIEKRRRETEGGDLAHAIREGLVELSQDVHALSYRLHPSVIEDLGLVAALRTECDRVARQESLLVDLHCQEVPKSLSADTALCLFRVAQEALRNVVRHARASAVEVSLQDSRGALELGVRDNGKGFDATRRGERPSLGLLSMRERVRSIGGELAVESNLGQGTRVVARVPIHEETRA